MRGFATKFFCILLLTSSAIVAVAATPEEVLFRKTLEEAWQQADEEVIMERTMKPWMKQERVSGSVDPKKLAGQCQKYCNSFERTAGDALRRAGFSDVRVAVVSTEDVFGAGNHVFCRVEATPPSGGNPIRAIHEPSVQQFFYEGSPEMRVLLRTPQGRNFLYYMQKYNFVAATQENVNLYYDMMTARARGITDSPKAGGWQIHNMLEQRKFAEGKVRPTPPSVDDVFASKQYRGGYGGCKGCVEPNGIYEVTPGGERFVGTPEDVDAARRATEQARRTAPPPTEPPPPHRFPPGQQFDEVVGIDANGKPILKRWRANSAGILEEVNVAEVCRGADAAAKAQAARFVEQLEEAANTLRTAREAVGAKLYERMGAPGQRLTVSTVSEFHQELTALIEAEAKAAENLKRVQAAARALRPTEAIQRSLISATAEQAATQSQLALARLVAEKTIVAVRLPTVFAQFEANIAILGRVFTYVEGAFLIWLAYDVGTAIKADIETTDDIRSAVDETRAARNLIFDISERIIRLWEKFLESSRLAEANCAIPEALPEAFLGQISLFYKEFRYQGAKYDHYLARLKELYSKSNEFATLPPELSGLTAAERVEIKRIITNWKPFYYKDIEEQRWQRGAGNRQFFYNYFIKGDPEGLKQYLYVWLGTDAAKKCRADAAERCEQGFDAEFCPCENCDEARPAPGGGGGEGGGLCGSIAGYFCGSGDPAHLYFQIAPNNILDVTPARPIAYVPDPNRNCVVTCSQEGHVGELCLLIPGDPPTTSCSSRNDSLTPQPEPSAPGSTGSTGAPPTPPAQKPGNTRSGNMPNFQFSAFSVKNFAMQLFAAGLAGR